MFKLKDVERYYNESGEVGVLVSGGFGAGYSTWNDVELREFLIFDKTNVELILNGDYEGLTTRLNLLSDFLGEYVCVNGVDDLSVVFVTKGTAFEINEYDGSESLSYLDKVDWNIA